MSSVRRLAKDHASLRASLPPNYLFPHSSDPILNSISDDLTNLTIYLTGPTSTPYTSGLFLLHLRIPQSYPSAPPTATFRTKIFHPNVDEKTGAVCLETLKRDWDPKLTLKDILVHISCLLLQPNPDSALNEDAGVLVREDYDGFERKARLMTKIHASVPRDYEDAAHEARTRGEDPNREDRKGLKVKTKDNGRSDGKLRPMVESKFIPDLTTKENGLGQGSAHPRDVSTESVLGKRTVSMQQHQNSEDVSLQALNSGSILRNQDTGEPQRKSPKHDPKTDTCNKSSVSGIVKDSIDQEHADTESAKLKSSDEPISQAAESIARPPPLRQISNVGSGKLRPYARIGIRRL